MNLQQLKEVLVCAGAKKLYVKKLAPNDNNKNQPYFGPDFEALNLFPATQIAADGSKNIKAKMDFLWALSTGELLPARSAQLILYPQYPEVRFSGFLEGCRSTSSEWDRMKSLMKERSVGRLLFLGVTDAGQTVGHVVAGGSSIAKEIHLHGEADSGVFYQLPLPQITGNSDSKTLLLAELRRIHELCWIDSKQLDATGRIDGCNAPQCGGLTLEAELKIPKNSSSMPDFLGWEVKQHSVTNFDRPATGGAITMMTPEPTGGFYRERGVDEFVRRFGYEDRNGVRDRLNFGGRFTVGNRHPLTGLTLRLDGYDLSSGKITDTNGAIVLINDDDIIAASWKFTDMISHWSRKHAQAVYVPSKRRRIDNAQLQYAYGGVVRLAEQTDALRLFAAVAAGILFYDPAIKVENASTPNPTNKRRSQWRVASKQIAGLYKTVETVSV